MSTAKKRKTKTKLKKSVWPRRCSIFNPDRDSRLGTLEFDATRAVGGDRRAALRPPRLPARVEAFRLCLPRRVAGRRSGGGSSDRGRGQRDPAVLGPDGLGSLFLTGNCDTVYFLSFMDLSDGPMVLDVPPLGPPSGILGDRRHVVPLGHRLRPPRPRPGPGGRYLIVGPATTGRSRTGLRLTRAPRPHAHHAGGGARPGVHGRRRSWARGGGDPRGRPASSMCPPPRARRWQRSSPATFRPSPRSHRTLSSGSSRAGVAFNTIAPNDFGYWETVEELVQAGAGRRG